jgi:uncharacterized NAD-dependent epimerase/dehydratase family protein
MGQFPEGNAIVYCEAMFGTTNGKTAHGLVRRTDRYHIISVVDSLNEGKDAGFLLDGKPNGIPVYGSIDQAVESARNGGAFLPTHLVIGMAPDGGRLEPNARQDVMTAINLGLHVDSGLHDFFSEDDEISHLAETCGVRLRDVRKPPPQNELHFFTGQIEEVKSLKIALLGTDSAIGKRTTAWVLLDALRETGYSTELVGTGQTAWLQGTRYGIILDSLINDFVAGEIEHAMWTAWKEKNPDVIIIEGQGSLMNPAYPGGLEILAAGRPDVVVLQHAPTRKEYDGFPGFPLHSLERQIQAIELVSSRPVVAISVNHEKLQESEVFAICANISKKVGLPACDVLLSGAGPIINALRPYIKHVPSG